MWETNVKAKCVCFYLLIKALADTRGAKDARLPSRSPFLGGLSLHLNHLIASCMANYDWPFGTLPFGLFGSNLDTRDLETYPRIYSGHF